MAKAHSTGAPLSVKAKKPTPPAKPYPDFPLFPLWNGKVGRWAKKIKGRLVYFGSWDDPEAALAKYDREKDALHRGVKPGETPANELTVYNLSAKFLTTKKRMLESGELSVHSFNDYAATCKRLIKIFGKSRLVADLRPDDFEKLRAKLTVTWGHVRVGNEINRVRVVFNYALKGGLIDRPMIYGEGFKRPSKKTLRKHRAAQGVKMFVPEEIHAMLVKATPSLKAMLLLGVNCGFSNADVGTLPMDALDLESGWVDFARVKTGIARRCPLWPETVAALKEWLVVQPKAKDKAHASLVFLTAKGGTWAKETSDNPVSKETAKLLKGLGINGHRNFYALRHTLQTIGDEARDFLAVRAIMGHVSDDIADAYRERMGDERLLAVTNHVREWLFRV